MGYTIFSDSSSNITPDLAREWNVRLIPLAYEIEGETHMACGEPFDGHAFYDRLRAKVSVKTSMINQQAFEDAFEPVLREGGDLLYIGMSSGISGTVNAAELAAQSLRERYPERRILVRDTLAASFGEGLFVRQAARMRDLGKDIESAARWVTDHVQSMNQLFTVDDLFHLQRGGRISRIAALMGTLVKIKPILYGDTHGRIAMCERKIGRKSSLKAIAERYAASVEHAEDQLIAIAHGDCEEDANLLVSMIRERFPRQQVLMRCYEPGTGSHVGPGAIALFFFGKPRMA